MTTITILELAEVTHITPVRIMAQANNMLIHPIKGAEYSMVTKLNLTEARWVVEACK